jgi:hypothetical protein
LRSLAEIKIWVQNGATRKGVPSVRGLAKKSLHHKTKNRQQASTVRQKGHHFLICGTEMDIL